MVFMVKDLPFIQLIFMYLDISKNFNAFTASVANQYTEIRNQISNQNVKITSNDLLL